MSRDDIVKLVIWTMKYYGSNARDRAEPGSKLQSQAEHIAEVMVQYEEAQMRLSGLEHVRVKLANHNV